MSGCPLIRIPFQIRYEGCHRRAVTQENNRGMHLKTELISKNIPVVSKWQNCFLQVKADVPCIPLASSSDKPCSTASRASLQKAGGRKLKVIESCS